MNMQRRPAWIGPGGAGSKAASLAALVAVALASRSCGLAAQDSRPGPHDAPPGIAVHVQIVDGYTGTPVGGAMVSLWPEQGSAGRPGIRITGEDGRSRFPQVPPGTHRLAASAFGYRDGTDTVTVPSDADVHRILRLSPDPLVLQPLVVTPDRPGSGAVGAERERRIRSATFVLGREDIEGRKPRVLTDLLTLVPGGRVVPTHSFGRTLVLRGGCRPGVWIDRVRILRVESLDELISPIEVESVEVYHDFELPVEFGADACGGVLIWTRAGDRPAPAAGQSAGRGPWRRVAVVVAFVVLAVASAR